MKKFYFVLLINNKSKNIFENNMNKKQLTESIMVGVRRAFRENKSLNEGFSQWKEQNVPKIDYDTLKTNINNLASVLEQLMGSKQIDAINIVYHNEASASWATLIEIVRSSVIVNGVYDAFKQLKSKYCGNDEDKFVQAINNLYFKLYIPQKSHLMKYIQSKLTIDNPHEQYFTSLFIACIIEELWNESTYLCLFYLITKISRVNIYICFH